MQKQLEITIVIKGCNLEIKFIVVMNINLSMPTFGWAIMLMYGIVNDCFVNGS